MSQTRCLQRRVPPQGGFTLIEFLVALVIAMLVLLAAVASLLGTRSTALTGNDVNALNQSSILAFRALGQQIRQAGYTPIDPSGSFYYFDTIAGVTQVSGEPAFFAIKGSETTEASGNDTLKVGYAPSPDHFRDCLGQEGIGKVTYDATEPAAATNPRLITSEFAVKDGSLRCTGSNGTGAQPIIDGVERFDVLYGIGTSPASAQVARYVDASDVHDFAQVRTVRVCLQLVGASQSNPDGQHVDCDGVSQSSRDGRLRRVYTAVFALRNQ